MIQFDFAQDCCGCGACSNVCPVQAIQMQPDANGFLFPQVDAQRCIQCGKCDRVCPHLNAAQYRKPAQQEQGTWLFASPDQDAKLRSASGGAFYELALLMLRQGGAVAGCVWDEELCAVHLVSDTEQALHRMQGSKYLQSDVNTCYAQVLKMLKQGRRVLFSGTPCQCVAMHGVVMAEKPALRDSLLTAAVLCHGVAAPGVWASHKRWLEQKQGSKLVDVNFRDKSQEGYKKSYCKYRYADGTTTYLPTYLPSSPYIESTLVYNLAIRSSCAHCDCKGVTEGCDLILGDWYAAYEGEGRLGTSCLVACTARGKAAAEQLRPAAQPFSYEQVLKDNGFIENSVHLGAKREQFLATCNDEIWDHVERFYPPKYPLKKFLLKTGLYDRLKRH